MVFNDVSIHFTIKGQSVKEINEKIDKLFETCRTIDFSEPTEPRTVLHHCFLPEKIVEEKGFSNEIYEEVLNHLSEHQVCWYGVSGELGLPWDRTYMLENIKKCKGICVFLGDLTAEGIRYEYRKAKELGCNIIHIP